MKKISTGLLLLTAAIGITSCSQDDGFTGIEGETGSITLSLNTDGRVMRQTRADDNVSPVVPNSSEFGVKLAKSDGSFSKTWKSLDLFNKEKAFPIGDYTLSAEYGDIDTEGYNAPCYTGSTTVHVSPSVTTDAKVTATLANAMVSIRYTQDFRDAFPAYSASVQTAGHDWVVFAQEETRPAYIAPSEVKLNLKLTNKEGKMVELQPAGFTAVARHHYVVTIGVTDKSGDLMLDVVFDEDVVSETVEVSLGDELFNAPAPSVTPKGFENGASNKAFEYAEYKGEARFDVFSFGGLKGATINVISDNGHTPSFGKSVELVNADANVQAQLANDGVACYGFFRNVDKMGVVDLKEFLKKLPQGHYEIELQVKDAMTRTSEPVKFVVNVEPVLSEFSSNVNPELLATEIAVDLATNCPDIKDNVTFRVPNAQGQHVAATVKSVTALTGGGVRPRASLDYKFRYVLSIDPISTSSLTVKAKLGEKAEEDIVVAVAAPAYNIVTDAFAHKVVFKIESENSDLVKFVCDNVVIKNDGSSVPTSNIRHEGEGFISVSGLNAGITYPGFIFKVKEFEKNVTAFTTESENQIANGNFESTAETINIGNLNAGGQYKYGATTMQNKSSIIVSEPTGWASINQKTCWKGSNPQNTWFMVPSTLASGGKVTIRSVAYDHNGTLPPLDNHGLNVRKKYSRNAPASFTSKAAGELFLGEYSFNGSESRTDGVNFSSRPTTLTFDYQYSPVGYEKGEAYIALLASDGSVLSEIGHEIEKSDNERKATVTLPAYPFGKKAAKIVIRFVSAKGSDISAPVPTDLEDVSNTTSLSGQTIGTNAYKSLCVGSKLTIDNVTLGYDNVMVSTKAVRKASAKKTGNRR